MTTVNDILKIGSEHFGMSPIAVMRLHQDKTAMKVRSIVVYVSHECLGLSLQKISRALGRADHKSTHFAYARAKDALENDPQTAQELLAVQGKVIASLESLVAELAYDLPQIVAENRDGATISAIAEWFGITRESAINIAELAVAEGRVKPVFKRTGTIVLALEPLY